MWSYVLLRTRTATSARDFSASLALHEEMQKEATMRHINMDAKRKARGSEHRSGRRGTAMVEANDTRVIAVVLQLFLCACVLYSRSFFLKNGSFLPIL